MRKLLEADALAPGEVRAFRMSDDDRGRFREALVLRDHEGVVRAYLNRCQHLPIPLDGGSGEYLTPDGRALMCGTHGAVYRLEDGFCIEGPCVGSSLLALPIVIGEGGWVELLDDG